MGFAAKRARDIRVERQRITDERWDRRGRRKHKIAFFLCLWWVGGWPVPGETGWCRLVVFTLAGR
jgi:hypothetical protein